MTLTQICWISIAAFALHIFEEFTLDWVSWANAVSGRQIGWDFFYVGNALAIVLGIVAAELASSLPVLALSFPVLLLINAIFFHLAASLATRMRFSPGLLSAVLLFIPLGFEALRAARKGGMSVSGIFEAVLLAILLMLIPPVLLRLRNSPYFRRVH